MEEYKYFIFYDSVTILAEAKVRLSINAEYEANNSHQSFSFSSRQSELKVVNSSGEFVFACLQLCEFAAVL